MNSYSSSHTITKLIGCKSSCYKILKCDFTLTLAISIPGIPPTGKKLQIAFTAVVNIRGDRLYHEHIAWDQASVLVQLGLMPEYLSFPYPLKDGTKPKLGKKFEYRVPAAGIETVQKMLDKNGVKSNEMFAYRIREVDASLAVPKL